MTAKNYIDVKGWGRLFFAPPREAEEGNAKGRRGLRRSEGIKDESDESQLFPGRLNDSAVLGDLSL